MIGDVIEIVSGSEPLKIHWFSPAVKKSGVTGKWTADFLPGGTEPSLECRQRDNVIPVPVVWTKKGFSKQHGGKLTKQSATLIEEWIETWEALEWNAERCPAAPQENQPQQQQRAVRQKEVKRVFFCPDCPDLYEFRNCRIISKISGKAEIGVKARFQQCSQAISEPC